MKVLVSTPIFPPEIGGPATYAVEMARRLQERGHKVRIVAFTDEKPQIPDLEVIPVRIRYKILGTLSRQIRLFLALLSAVGGMDLIYLQDPMVVGVTSLLVGKLTGKPLVLKFVGDSVWEKEHSRRRTNQNLEEFLGSSQKTLAQRLRAYLLRFVLGNMNRIIVPSLYLHDILVTHYRVKSEKIAVVYNSVDLKAIERAAGGRGQQRGKQVIAIGRMVRHKRIEGIIAALSELRDEFPGITLALVGDGPERESLEKLAGEMGVTKRLRFYGSIDHDKTLALLKASDVFVLNSIYEGLPHTVIEAMACSVPVVATDIRGTNEAVDNGRTGLLIPPDNEPALADGIARLFKNTKLAEQLAEKALATVSQKFTWESNLAKLEAELEKATGTDVS